jgi:serine/threonine-protein kinase
MLLSMEYFDGKNLEDCSTLSLVDVLLVFRMIASGLNAMHQHGFVHCDIKPNNILINKAGSIKIIDLGQSCKIGTVKPRIQGTPDYIAPEQVKRKPLGPKTDIFNLGATMYWALTGKHAPTMIPKKNKFGLPVVEPRRAPNELKKQLPTGISKLVMDCIEDDPTRRPRNMMTVMSRLDLMVHSIFGEKIKTNNKNASNNS